MLGKTNACVGGSSSGGGETLTAVNKTGATINKGDKVWLNDNARDGGTKFNVGKYRGLITRSGEAAWCDASTYSLDKDSATKIGNVGDSNVTNIR